MQQQLNTGFSCHVVGNTLHHFGIQNGAVTDDLVFAAGCAVSSPLHDLINCIGTPNFLGRLDNAVDLSQSFNSLFHKTLQ